MIRGPECMYNGMTRLGLFVSRWLRVLLATAFPLCMVACSTFGHHGSGEGPGANVYPNNYRAELLSFLQTYLNDPTNVREAEIAEPALRQVNSIDRYVVCLKYNAKNTDGRYVGVKETIAIYLHGRFNQLVDATTGDTCKGATYEPFPELTALKR
jgi:hypothetical protein